jgi:hypothetical protein
MKLYPKGFKNIFFWELDRGLLTTLHHVQVM